MKTMKEVKADCVARIERAFVPALVKAKDEVDVNTILWLKEKANKPKNETLKNLRFAANILEEMAEREA